MKNLRLVTLIGGLIATTIFLSSCSNKDKNIESIKTYLHTLDNSINEISEVLLSEKFVANPDSVAITEYVMQVKDTTSMGIEQKMWLLMGNEIYFSPYLNKGSITGKQISNIKRVSAQYNELKIRPESYAIFSIIKYTDRYGQHHTSQLAFLLNNNDSIIKHKEIELCPEMLEFFKDDEIGRVID